MQVGKGLSLAPLVCLVALGLTASSDGIRSIDGDCASLYDGKVCTWGTTSGDKVVEFGATVPVEVIEEAPLDLPMVFPPAPVAVIELPAEVARGTGFNHLMITLYHTSISTSTPSVQRKWQPWIAATCANPSNSRLATRCRT
jgi:hypothetical protein